MIVNWKEGGVLHTDTATYTMSKFFNPVLNTQYTVESVVDSFGCTIQNSDTLLIVVNSLPTITMSGLASQYCADDTIQLVQATPLGGLFNGPVNTQGELNPKFVAGNITVYYEFTDANMCTAVDSIQTIIYPNPFVSIISQIDSQYCSNSILVNLYSYPQGGTYTGSLGVIGNQFDPSKASIGINQIIYSFTDANSCSNIDTVEANVMSAPLVSIATVLDSSYCEDATSVSLSATPSGGTYIGI